METISVIGVLTVGFAAANLAFQVGAGRYMRHSEAPKPAGPKAALEHPVYTRIDGMPRSRANRHDMQLAIGHDFAAPDVQDQVWPRDPRI
jgi:hypothetical protein